MVTKTINDSGSVITLHRTSDTTIPITRWDEDGIQIDIRDTDLVFAVEGLFTVVPAINPDDTKGRVINLTQAHARQLGNREYRFLLFVDGVRHEALWEGKIRATGVAA